MKSRLVLLGPPATGKGTQAALLAATFRLPTASTGAMLREEARRGTPDGLAAAEVARHGGMFSDDLALRVVWAWLGERTRFLLDGFPRTLGQATAFDAGLAERRIPLDMVVLLELPEPLIHERIAGRLTCQGCGAVYNRAFHRTDESTPCPACGDALHRREDDTEQAIELRLREYRDRTLPVCEHYRQAGILSPIDATPGRDAVFKTLYEMIRS